jgi:phosphatidate cytidylyltransferase
MLLPADAFDQRDLRLRLASAALLGPTALIAVWFGQGDLAWLFMVLIAVAAALLSVEWGLMSAPNRPARVAAAVVSAVLVAIFCGYYDFWMTAWFSLAVGCAGAAAIARGFSERITDAAFGVLYIGIPCLMLLWLRTGGEGRAWTLLLLLTVWAADGGAFFVGKLVGGPKLWPRFSPNKTWSGFFGGLAAATTASLVHVVVIGPSLFWPVAIVLGFLTGAAAMAGDLWESMLKRRFGVKDSGDLIPGHGGLLDRVDGLMFATIAVGVVRVAHERGWLP